MTGFSTEEMEVWELPVTAARGVEGLPMKEKGVLLKYIKKQLKKN